MIKITDEEFQYLSIQKRDITPYIEYRNIWENEYLKSLDNFIENVMEFLPEKCKNILDIGSGLGGINILLNDLYSKKTKIFLVDGEADSPVYNVETTYNNMSVAKQFLIDNGVSEVTYSTPDAISTETYKKPKQKFDLVVSVDACGFRFSPEMYIEFIKENTKKGAILIFDVRSHKEDWKKILSDNFEVVGIVDTTDKRERIIYKVV